MKILSKLLCGALLAGTSLVNAQSVEFMSASDNAVITIKREVANGDTTWSAISPNPDLIEYNDGTLFCRGGVEEGTKAVCSWEFTLKTDYPGVPFNQFPAVTWRTPYGYVEFSEPTAMINTTRETGPIHLGDIITYPTTDINNRGAYINVHSPDAGSKASVRQGYDDVAHKVVFAEISIVDIPGASVLYQNFQVLASGIPKDLDLVKDNNLVTPGYEEASTNKGQFIGTWQGSVGYQWYLYGWNTGSGHYAEWRFLTNGTSKNDPGLDLSEYSTLEFAISCFSGMTIEAFFGTTEDSSQNFLGDITCNQTEQTFSFDISNVANTSDIQTALWLHIPTWKNGHVSQSQTLDMNIPYLRIKR